jgi:hypothetical protein
MFDIDVHVYVSIDIQKIFVWDQELPLCIRVTAVVVPI